MKKLVYVALFVMVAGPVVVRSEEAKSVDLSSRISAVTVYSDRALVTRDAEANLKPGSAVYSFCKLPGWVDEGSIRVSLLPASAGRIADVRIKREYLAKAGDEDIQKAEAAMREVEDRMNEMTDELKVLDEQAKQIEAIRAFSLDKLPKDAAVRDISVENFAGVVNYVSDSLRKIAVSRRAIGKKVRELQPELNILQKKRNDLQQMKQLEQCTVTVTIEAADARKAQLSLKYMLPGATWEPAHELRVEGADPKKVKLASCAVVTQTTGEEWDGAVLSFSTQSSAENIRIPELDALLLGSSRSLAQMTGGLTVSFQEAQQRFAGQQLEWNKANWKDAGNRPDFTGNNLRMIDVQRKTTTVFSRLQTRGTTAHFQGLGRPMIRFDGRPIRVPIGEVELESSQQIVAVPEMFLNAVRTLRLVNTGRQPFLPGQTALHHDGAFLGETDLDFVAAGETFAVFLGVADQVKLARVMDRRNSSLVRGKRTRMQVAFDVTAENLSDKDVSLSLTDRIPVSEDKDITVRDVEIRPVSKPSSKGLLKWDLSLKPKEKQTIRIEYTVEYPAVSISELMKSKSGQAMPSAPADFYKSIESLEKAF